MPASSYIPLCFKNMMLSVENLGRGTGGMQKYFIQSLPFLLLSICFLVPVYYFELLVLIGLPEKFLMSFCAGLVPVAWALDLVFYFSTGQSRLYKAGSPAQLALSCCGGFAGALVLFALLAKI